MARIVRIHEYGDASVLKLEDLDVPAPAANEVQIDVKAIGLNRAEVMFRNHAYLQEAEFPSRLGYEAAIKDGHIKQAYHQGNQTRNAPLTTLFFLRNPGMAHAVDAEEGIHLYFCKKPVITHDPSAPKTILPGTRPP